MGFRILCSGDIHLGRRAADTPAGAAGEFTPRAAWEALVARAETLEVDAVALTGDVVDQDNQFYEAFSVLHAGVTRLVERGIGVFAVAGNHDFDVLARVADSIDAFHLLGRGGRWEEIVVEPGGAPAVRMQGWSFASKHFTGNPLDGYRPPTDDLPTVALLHCDCDVAGSLYGPVTLRGLKDKSPTAWLLGHIHKGAILSDQRPLILYPGSLQGLDPSEQGPHGAWLVTIDAAGPPTAELLPLAGLRWEQIDVPLDDVDDESTLESVLAEALRGRHGEIRGELEYAGAVGCRLTLTGRTGIHRRLWGLVPQIEADLRPSFDGVEYFIDKIADETRPAVPLADIARSDDPAGLLAQRLVLLESRRPKDAYHRLIREARSQMDDPRRRGVYAPLPGAADALTDDAVRDLLMKAGLRVLDHLLADGGRAP